MTARLRALAAMLAIAMPALAAPSSASGNNPCALPKEFLDWDRLEAALVHGDYAWAPTGCPSRSLLAQAKATGTPVQQLARDTANGMGGVAFVQARLVLRSPAFDADSRWRQWVAVADNGAGVTALRDQYPDFHASPYIGPLFDQRLDEAQWTEAKRRADAYDPTVEHLATPAGHPALAPAMELLGWTNPTLSAAPEAAR